MASEAATIPLARLQRWMQAVVVHPGTPEEAVASSPASEEVPASGIADVIRPSRTLSPLERVAIYQRMYPIRMYEALAGDYPGLEHFLGEEGFDALVRAYIQVHPSRSYSLNRLGDRLPDFIRTYPGVRRQDFCHELAGLELAVTEVFDGPESPRLSEAAVAGVPPEAWESARLEPVAAFRLLSFRYPVNAYLQSVRDDNHDHPKARLRDTWVAVYRRDYAVYRLDLSRSAHELLADLVSGATLGDAIAAALRRGGKRAPSEHELFRWFREWVSGGVFSEIRGGTALAGTPPHPSGSPPSRSAPE
jgi:hypothetical protein